MQIRTDAQIGQACAELIRRRLPRILGDDHGIGQKPFFTEGFNEADDLFPVGQPGVLADLVAFKGGSVDDHHDFRVLLQLGEHFELTVRLEAGKDAGSMIIVKKLATEFQIKLVAEHGDAFPDML